MEEAERRRRRSGPSPAERGAEEAGTLAQPVTPVAPELSQLERDEPGALDQVFQPDAELPIDEFSCGTAEETAVESFDWDTAPSVPAPRLEARKRGTLSKPAAKHPAVSPEQRLLLLDTWQRSRLPAGDFAALVGISKHTLYAWKKRFDELGPAGLAEQKRGRRPGSKLPELTRRTILMLKQAHPVWGCQRISDMLFRGPALPASPSAVARVLHEAGYELEEVPTRRHEPPVPRFERAARNENTGSRTSPIFLPSSWRSLIY